MTILFSGTEFDAFDFPGTGAVVTTANYFDATYVRHALDFPDSVIVKGVPWGGTQTDVWLHMEWYVINSTNAVVNWAGLLNAAGSPIVRLNGTIGTARDMVFEYFNGTSWVTIASFVPAADARQIIDIQYKNTATGEIACYIDGFLLGRVTGDFSALANAATFGLFDRPTGGIRASQVIVADEPTIGFKLAYRQPTGNGFHTAWAGDFSNVNATVPASTSFINTPSINATETFTRAAFTLPNGFKVKAVAVQALLRRGTTGPQQAAFLLRFGSTDHVGPDIPLDLGYTAKQYHWHDNPATSLPWVPADAASATVEFGLRAKA